MADTFPGEWQLREEITAREEEGYEVTEARERLEAIAGQAEAVRERQRIYAVELAEAPRRPDFGYEELSDFREIRALRPEGPRTLKVPLNKTQLADRTLGAWLGRSAGCLLGKLCEGWHRHVIEQALRALGEWPLGDYWPRREELPEGFVFRGEPKPDDAIAYPRPDDPQLRGNITHMLRDDDMDYPIIGLAILEQHGLDFTTDDVGHAWLSRLPYFQTYTAERVAYRNLVDGLRPPETATYRNPYREWIGAQIRADIFGWVCPGRPELAAELAWRDAALSHTKNGIYGEMFFAAMLSAAFAVSDLHALIDIGLSEIPVNCRLREAVLDTVQWCDEDDDWEQTWDRIAAKYGHYHGVHTINNAAIVLMGLLHSREDFEQAITIAVMGGWDTDCNGATAGSVVGAIMGAKALPKKWIGPLDDRIRSMVVGFDGAKITSLAKRTGALQQQVKTR